MKTKIFLFLFLSALVWSCTSEPEFPDPGFDKTRTSIDTVRRDTIDTYTIKMDISAPNGVKTMQVLNGRTYSIIDEVDEFNGMTDFTFTYDVDLTSINKDTVMQYVVKVVDNSMRSYNKGFILNVKDFSKPVITIVGGKDVMGLVSPVFELKALFETGMNTIDSYKVVLDGETIDSYAFTDTLMSEFKYKHVIQADLQLDKPSVLSVELKDSKGEVNTRTMQLKLIEMKKPTKFTYSTELGLHSEYELTYDENERLSKIFCTGYAQVLGPDGHTVTKLRFHQYDFLYTEEGLLHGWEYYELDEKGEQKVEKMNDQYFKYDEQGRFVESYDSDNSPWSSVKVTEYYDHGGFKAYTGGGSPKPIENIHYTQELDGSGYFYTEWPHMNKSDRWRQHITDMTAVRIPTYMPELPAITSLPMGWDDVFTRKYVGGKIVYSCRTPQEDSAYFSYSTDENGRLVQLKRTVPGYRLREAIYVFSYDED